MQILRKFRYTLPTYKFSGKRISIIVVENHYVTMTGIDLLLSNLVDFEIIGKAHNSEEAIQLVTAVNADVVLYDLLVPGSKSIEIVLNELTKTGAKVVIFSSESRSGIVKMAMNNGASAFLSKSESLNRICETIRDVAAGAKGFLSLDLRSQIKTKLFPAEEEILKLLARGMRYEQIGELRHTSTHTVRGQCMHIQKKLGLSSREVLIVWAVENGYGCTSVNDIFCCEPSVRSIQHVENSQLHRGLQTH